MRALSLPLTCFDCKVATWRMVYELQVSKDPLAIEQQGLWNTCRWLAPLYNMKSLRLLRCRGIYHVNTAVFAGHPYLRVFDSEFSTWQAPPLLGDGEED